MCVCVCWERVSASVCPSGSEREWWYMKNYMKCERVRGLVCVCVWEHKVGWLTECQDMLLLLLLLGSNNKNVAYTHIRTHTHREACACKNIGSKPVASSSSSTAEPTRCARVFGLAHVCVCECVCVHAWKYLKDIVCVLCQCYFDARAERSCRIESRSRLLDSTKFPSDVHIRVSRTKRSANLVKK